ncbi:MAG: hypothetical protein BWY76_01293 [bacterium ADurb.Bin429]|nr:MAG: hypothetical protein BWY76_01293 [bacterium ADurb.Bin429]
MRARWLVSLILLLAGLPLLALELRNGDTVTIPEGTTINDDLIVSGGTVRVDGAVASDLVVAGGNVRVNGRIGGNLIAAGGNVRVAGPVAGTIYAAGGTLDLESAAGRNLVVTGGTVTLGPEGSVARDIAVTGGQVVLAGTVARNVMVGAGNLTVEDTARIGGDLTGQASSREIAPGAVIEGATNLTQPTRGEKGKEFGVVGWFLWKLFTAVGLLLIGLLAIAGAPRFTREAITMIGEHPWGSLLAGLIVLFLTPLVILILFALVITIPLALLLLLLWLAALLVAPVFAVLRIGAWVWRRGANLYAALLLGVLIYFLVRLIPVLGDFVGFLVLVFGLGALALTLQARTASPLFHRPEPPGPVETEPET